MAKGEMTPQERMEKRLYLLNRAYPLRDHKRGLGNKEFLAELSEQPD
jgi:hypothetical protein